MFDTALAATPLAWPLWIALGASFLAGLMRGFAGFGSAMMLAPVFAVLMGPAHMVPVIMAMELPIGAVIFMETRKQTEWRFVGPMAAAAVVTMPLGVWLLLTIDTRVLTVVISIVVILFVGILASGWRYRGPRRTWLGMSLGGMSGAMMATTSVGGPPILLYMLAGKDSASTVRANIVAYFLVTSAVVVVMVLAAAPTAATALVDATTFLPTMWLGTWLGSRAHHGASDVVYRRIAYVVLLVAAGIGLVG
jgi:hypothetical protein